MLRKISTGILSVIISMLVYGEESMSAKFTDSNLMPKEVDSRLKIIQHPIMRRYPGGCKTTGKTPNGAYMWVKSVENGNELVVVYLENAKNELIKVDEFKYVYDEIPRLSHPVEVEVEDKDVVYFSGSNPNTPRRILYRRPRLDGK
jgi:hypothetical protein